MPLGRGYKGASLFRRAALGLADDAKHPAQFRIEKKKRTIGTPEFRHFTEAGGRFVNLLPVKDGAVTLH